MFHSKFGQLKNDFLDKETEAQYREEIEATILEENRKRLVTLAAIATCAMAVMFLCSFCFDSLEKNRGIYIVLGAVSLYVAVISAKYRNKRMITGTIYIFVFALFAFGILLGTFIEPNETSVSFPILLFAVPLLFTENIWRMNIAVMIGIVAYCIAAYYTQDALMLQYNLTNVIPYGLFSMFICSFNTRAKYSRYELQYRNDRINRELKNKQEALEKANAALEEARTAAEKRSEFTEHLYGQILKFQTCGVIAFTLPNHDIIAINDAAKLLYGYDIGRELSPQDIMAVRMKVEYDNPETTKQAIDELKPGNEVSYTMTIPHGDGTTVRVLSATKMITLPDGETAIITSLQDISTLEETMEHNNRLKVEAATAKATNEAKSQFLFNMSHDIRTPMNAIIGFTELMEKKKDDPEAVSDYLEKIRSSGEYLLTIINNILDMARIESGKETVDESVMDLLEEERKVLDYYTELARKKHQTFTTRYTIQHRYVFVDVAKQREIMTNLLSNALKYTPEGGNISVVLEELPSEKEGFGTFRLTVSDNGIGMSKEFQSQLFDSFTREKNSTESKVIGTGLGMAIVKKLVDLLGGTIQVESELGKGTTFIITLDHRFADNAEAYLEEKNKTTISDKVLMGKRILLAEDNDLNAEIVQTILEEYGVKTERAKDGVECIQMMLAAQKEDYDLILMDIQMPNLDGYKTTRILREAGVKIPIIAMTANAYEEDKQNALQAGMNGHLSKPIDISEFLKVLSNEMAKEIDTDESNGNA